jgi:hypothetical protein
MFIKGLVIKFVKNFIQKNKLLEKWYGIRPETKEFYSQFGEDASLQTFFSNQEWTKEKKAAEIPKGFYVDIGCYNPIEISNTYWFFKRGWKGINVDLSTEAIAAFNNARPNDINLVAAITNSEAVSEIDFFEFGLSSVYNTLDEESARQTQKTQGLTPVKRKIQSMGLNHLFEKHLPEGQEISFLSVDAEGHDLEILKSNNWTKYKPKAIVVEIHEPNFHSLGKNEVIQFLEGKGYVIYSWLNPSVILVIN